MKERIVIIFIAIIAGLFITSAGFFIYQSTKKGNDTPLPKKTATNSKEDPQQPTGKLFVKVAEPKDESLSEKRTLVLKGTTNADNIVVVSSNLEDVEVKPNQDGDFSVSVDIDAGANPIITRVIAPDGSSAQDIRTITYSTDDF